MNNDSGTIREQWLTPETARQKIRRFEERFGPEVLTLARHAALPLIITPELINLIHINFLDNHNIHWIAESDILLSSLCRPVDDEMYEFEPRIREILLEGLPQDNALKIADFLLTYQDKSLFRIDHQDVAKSYRWIALAYLKPHQAIEELEKLFRSYSGHELHRQEQIEMVNMAEFLSSPLSQGNLKEKCQEMLKRSRRIAQALYEGKETIDVEPEQAERERTQNKPCLVIMPFGQSGTPEYSQNRKIYDQIISPVVEDCGYTSIYAEEIEHTGSIIRKTIELLHESELVIADLSSHNTAIFYALGVRHVLHRSGTIHILREGETLPFNIANYRAIFYSNELDSPEQFKRELKGRIKALEKFQRKKPDNPVHDILGDKLLVPNVEDYVSIKIYNTKRQEVNSLKREVETIRKRLKRKKMKKVHLRSEPKENLSYDEVKRMLKERDFFTTGFLGPKNKKDKGLNHQYEVIEKEGEKLVIDHTTGLTWQQSGSTRSMTYAAALKWIEDLNKKGFAGYDDWRLPTLEEAMSLMETEEKNSDLYINYVFNKKQRWIWTADKESSSVVWVVLFVDGYCYNHHVDYHYFVRAVR